MKTTDLAALAGFSPVVEAPPQEIRAVYCADLLSWAMARTPEGAAWCTVMGNANAVAVAALAGAAALIICEGAAFAEDAAEKAREHGVCVFRTGLPAFDAALAAARAAGLYGLGGEGAG